LYRKVLSRGGSRRHGLDGAPVEAVDPEHRAVAQEQLRLMNERRAKQRARQERRR
jgi:hypothetical protein